jgi:hypothetical protein
MVCVELGEDTPDGGRVVSVVLGTEPQDISLARDFRGHVLAYDDHMQHAQDAVEHDNRAITIAEHREWPDRPDWEEGPDALRYPGLYDTDDPADDLDEDNLDPLDLHEHDTAADAQPS